MRPFLDALLQMPQVYLLTHANTWATIKANSTVAVEMDGGKVTKENPTLNLKSGNLVSALDPTKRSVNNYQVRTPKGVAAARDTTFTVTVNGENYSSVTAFGVVSIAGGQASVSRSTVATRLRSPICPPREKPRPSRPWPSPSKTTSVAPPPPSCAA